MTGWTRRAALIAAALAPMAAAATNAPTKLQPAPRRLRLLILGGTRFTGPALVREALARGHDVTLFNRGETRPWLFPGLEQRRGNRYPDRNGGLAAIANGIWDAVFDVPAYFPRLTEASAALLAPRVGRYIMVSSISVYTDFRTVGIDEAYPTRPLAPSFAERPDLSEDWDFATYGGRKAACERAAERHFPGRFAAVRACGIAGGGLSDPTKWYWPARLYRDRALVAGGDGHDPIQLIDRRDIAAFLVRIAEQELAGIYNVAGPSLTFADYLERIRAVVGGQAEIIWTGAEQRERARAIPGAAPRDRAPGFTTISTERARKAGFAHRPLEETIAADWLWFRANRPLALDFAAAGHGLSAEAEAALIAELRRR